MAKSPSRHRKHRDQRTLKELAAAASAHHDHADADKTTERKEDSLLLEAHQRNEPGLANASPTAEDEASLLVRPDENQPPVSRDSQRSSRRATRLLSSAFHRRQIPAPSNAKTPETAMDNQQQSETSPRLPSSRRLTFFNSRANHQRPRATSMCSAIASTRFASFAALLGSLSVPTTETQLPLLDSGAQAALQLASASGFKAVEIAVRRSDELPFGVYSHPVVRIHVVDRCTGRALQPAITTAPGRFTDDGDNIFQWRETLKLSVDLRDAISPRSVLLFEVVEETNARKRRTLGGAKFEALNASHNEQVDDLDAPPMVPIKVRRIAWGFFHGVTEHGGLTLPRLLPSAPPSPSTRAKSTRKTPRTGVDVRLQMFQYQVVTWMDQYQARAQWGWRKNHPTVPPVFLQYQKRSRQPAPTTLYLRLGITRTPSTTLSTSELDQTAPLESPTDASDVAATDQVANDNPSTEVPPTETSPSPPSPPKDPTKPSEPDWLSKCRRDSLEPCLVPQRVLHSLPSGKQGCSSLGFSPCGRLLAGGVKTGLGEFHLNIYGVNDGARLCIGRGHQGIIYSVEWSGASHSETKSTLRIVTASSDGTARLWQLQLDDSGLDASKAHPRLTRLCEWVHIPSPCYVYCAVFHPLDANVVVTGASDGQVRFHIHQPSESEASPPPRRLQASSVAVHSIRLDGPSHRLFCGDASGVISVFSVPSSALNAAGYTRVKSISTGQASITAMQLHPRKGHLLVHTQPSALLQFELRSYLLLNRNYAGVSCNATLGKSVFSADGKWVASGSEDGTPRLFASLHGQEVVTGVWGGVFFHGATVSDVAWSPTAHMVALSSFGRNSPIVVLCASRDSSDAASPTVETWTDGAGRASGSNDDLLVGGDAGLPWFPQLELPLDDHTRRVQQILERRRRRLEAQGYQQTTEEGNNMVTPES